MNDKPMTIEEIHTCTLDVLRRIITICDELKIDYFLMYGSLIGAVRHGGFIPWDDDLDIAMLAHEFDAFCAYCKDHSEDLLPFKLIDPSSSEEYPFNIPRFCDTRYRMESDQYPTAGMGAFVDIYPLYGAGNMAMLNQEMILKKDIYQTGFALANAKKVETQKGVLGYIFKCVLFVFAKIVGRNFFIKKLNRLAHKYPLEQSSFVEIVVWDRERIAFEKELFESYELVKFEDIYVKVPQNYHKILTQQYGDYMQLPPKEKRIGHHEYRLYRK